MIKGLLILILSSLWIGLASSQDSGTAGCIDCELAKANNPKLSATIEQQAFNQLNFLDPALVESLDSRKLAEMIVNRLSEKCDRVRDPSMKPPADENTDIIMMVPDVHLESIQKYGFKNQHQTATTGGCNCQEKRANFESSHIDLGLPYTNKTRELLPKYALHVFNDEKHGMGHFAKGYGNVAVKFKPEVKKRATWTARDSLNNMDHARTYKIRDPKGTECSGYCESQVWGELDMTDVDSIYIQANTPVTDAMKSLNVPIYEYQEPNIEDAKKGIIPRQGSVFGVSFTKKQVFTPNGSPKGKDQRNIFEARKDLALGKNTAQKNFITSEILGKSSTNSLISQFESLGPAVPNDLYGINSQRARILSELASRKEKSVTPFLKKKFAEEKSPFVKAMALTGLTNLSWNELKPMIVELNSMEDRITHNSSLISFKLSIMRDHLDDPDIKKLHDKLLEIKPNLSFLQVNLNCVAESY